MTITIPTRECRLKNVATINNDTLAEDTPPDFELQYVDIGNVDSSGELNALSTYRFADAPSRARRRVRDGDVIISTVRTYLQAIASVREPPDNMIVSTGFAVVRPRPNVLDPGFCIYALREPTFLAEVEKRSVGVSYPAINAVDLGNVPIRLPAIRDQRLIADYLDRETVALDRLVAQNQRIFNLLTEKRQALITRAVTRGLDPDVRIRNSGIAWLGGIPKHWKITRLKLVADVRTGLALGKKYRHLNLSEYPYLSVANVQDGHLDLSNVKTVQLAEREARSYMLRSGDVLMNEGGDEDKLGRGCVWREQIPTCLHQNHVFAVRPRAVRSEWLNLWISSQGARNYFESHAKKTTNLASISASNVKELPLPMPPQAEQDKIVAHVTDAKATLDEARSAVVHARDLLDERRSALIVAALAGAIDVECNS